MSINYIYYVYKLHNNVRSQFIENYEFINAVKPPHIRIYRFIVIYINLTYT